VKRNISGHRFTLFILVYGFTFWGTGPRILQLRELVNGFFNNSGHFLQFGTLVLVFYNYGHWFIFFKQFRSLINFFLNSGHDSRFFNNSGH